MRTSDRTARLVSSAASDNATVAFNGPGILNNIIGENTKATAVWLKFYQLDATLAAPDSTKVPCLSIYLPAQSAFALEPGLKYSFGLGYRIVTGSADNDNSAVAAGDVLGLNLLASGN